MESNNYVAFLLNYRIMKPIRFSDLQVPQPCHENWDEMSPQERGRFCKSCQKVVYDFIDGDEKRLNEAWEQEKGKLCGRFPAPRVEVKAFQLLQKPAASKLRRWLITALAVLGIKGMFGQHIQEASSHAGSVESRLVTAHPDSIIRITGQVQEMEFSDPLERALILIEAEGELVIHTFSDSSGHFYLEIKAEQRKGEDFTLYVSHLGRNFVSSNMEWRSQNLKVELNAYAMMDQDQVEIFSVAVGTVTAGIPICYPRVIYSIDAIPNYGATPPAAYDLEDWIYMNNSEVQIRRN